MPRKKHDFTLYMETTDIPPAKTAGEITEILVRNGASSISTHLTNGNITGISFSMLMSHFQKGVPAIPFTYQLPVRVEPVFEIINGRRPASGRKGITQAEWRDRDKKQAERVAWRQLLRWVQAQFAMVETGMVSPVEVFLPYLMSDRGKTFFEEFYSHKLLEAGEPLESRG